MNHLFLLSLAICSSPFVRAAKRIDVLSQNYVIISDEFSADIAVGKCLVVGQIIEPDYTGEGQIIPLSGGLVATLDRKKTATSNAEGKYSLLLDSKDTSLFFYKSGKEEIVIWKYNFRSQHKVTINFYPGINSSMIMVDKPVIYMYSDEKINAEITFTCKGNLTFTYPEYNEKWEVTIDQNIITENKSGPNGPLRGKNYPYLFWEAQQEELEFEIQNQTMNGFLISTDSVINFLENSLTALGLNSTEQTDFITFWAPRMIVKPFALVHFLIGDDYAKNISELNITPTPDALRRVFMVFTPLETNQVGLTIKSQELKSFERFGFTVVEWGGSELNHLPQIP